MLKAKGTIKVNKKQSRIVVDVSPDFQDYYHWHIKKYFWIRLQYPLHQAHITLANKKFHKDIDWKKAKEYNDKSVDFEYDPYVVQGGYTKGFIMFYLKVYSEELDNVKRELNIIENDNWRGHHITIGQSGKGGSQHRPYWPEMITVKN